MPIYEYDCEQCGAFELSQRITDKPLRRCPTCKGRVRKLISNTSFQLKGTGWYVSDYAAKGRGGKKDKADGAAEPAPATQGKESAAAGDAKPAAKADATAA